MDLFILLNAHLHFTMRLMKVDRLRGARLKKIGLGAFFIGR